MVVVLSVTGEAIRLERHLGRWLDVAVFAARIEVFSEKRKFGLAVVEFRHVPVVSGMAGGAVLAQPGFVHVVFAVAGHAAGGRIGETLIGVTVGAFAPRVRAGQREVGLRMIEPDLLPLRAGVAGFAALAEIAFVLVVGPMTGDAGAGEIGVVLVSMTADAFDAPMRGVDRKVRLRMIEPDLLPIGFVVAALALGSKLTFVRFVWLMACRAVGRCLTVQIARPMTGLAIDAHVLFAQRIVGDLMIEARGLEDHDVLVAAAVIGVAGEARLSGRLEASVEAAARGEIGRDLFVAI